MENNTACIWTLRSHALDTQCGKKFMLMPELVKFIEALDPNSYETCPFCHGQIVMSTGKDSLQSEYPILTCGCAAQAWHVLKDGTRIASCIIHDCSTIAPESPDLSNRLARCSYYGKKPGRHNECNYGHSRDSGPCMCEGMSSPGLPFFSYKKDKQFDEFYCGCHGWD